MKINDKLIVSDIRMLNKDCFFVRLESEKPLPKISAGQFAMLSIPSSRHFLARPISIAFASEYNCSFIIKIVGNGTKLLSELKAGDVLNVILPLGNNFDITLNNKVNKTGSVILVGGGVGIPPLLKFASELDAQHINYVFIGGGQTKEDIEYFSQFTSKLKGKIVFCTDDGSLGIPGNVIVPVGDEGRGHIYSCGPIPMLRAVAGYAAKNNNAGCSVSLEREMGCGFGVCQGCVVEGTDGIYYRVCVDGPVFDSKLIFKG